VNCSEFQDKLDPYLDGELDDASTPLAAGHVHGCVACNTVVTEHQKARALLITAVADEAAAVDVSGLWHDIEARLESPRVRSLAAARARRAFRTGTGITRTRALGFAALTTAAAAAVVVLSLVTGGGDDGSKSTFANATPGRRTLAQSRPVRIDAMEVGAGHTVSTWVRPRAKTRIIWVARTGDHLVTPAASGR